MDIVYARRLAASYVVGSAANRAKTDEVREAVAQRMVANETAGKNACVWHCVHEICGTPCYCAACRPNAWHAVGCRLESTRALVRHSDTRASKRARLGR
jgi:hypothetical protein